MDHGRIRGLIGSDGVVLDRLVRAVLHQRNMLVRRRVVYDLRLVIFKYFEDPPAVTDRADQGHKIQLRIFFPELHLNVIRVIFIYVKNDQLLGRVRRDLPAELAADGAAASRDQDPFPVNEFKDFFQVGLDRLSAQKVFDGDLLHLAYSYFSADELIHSGKVLQLAVRLLADVQDVSSLLRRRAGDRHIDLVDVVFLNIFQDRVPAADDRNSVNEAPPLVGVVIYDTADQFVDFFGPFYIMQNRLAGISCSDQHDPVLGPPHFDLVFHHDEQTIGKPDARHKRKLQHNTDAVIGNGHAPVQKSDKDRMEQTGDRRCSGQMDQFGIAGIFPDTLIKPGRPENDQADYCVDRRKFHPSLKKVRPDRRRFAVEPQPQCEIV